MHFVALHRRKLGGRFRSSMSTMPLLKVDLRVIHTLSIPLGISGGHLHGLGGPCEHFDALGVSLVPPRGWGEGEVGMGGISPRPWSTYFW